MNELTDEWGPVGCPVLSFRWKGPVVHLTTTLGTVHRPLFTVHCPRFKHFLIRENFLHEYLPPTPISLDLTFLI